MEPRDSARPRNADRIRDGAGTALGLVLSLVLTLAGCSGATPAPPPPGPSPGAASPTPATATGGSSPTTVGPRGTQRFTRLTTDVGTLLQTTLAGSSSGVRMRVWVWLPPQYGEAANANRMFPALMLYPGGSGAGYNTWAGRQYGARELVARGAAQGSVAPFVFVMPEMQLSESRDTECADLPGQPRVGTFLAVDVRRMVEQNFRVRTDRAGWGAVGASSGAYCALRVTFNHPDQYAAAVSIDGYFTLETDLPGANVAHVLAQDPAAIATTAPPNLSVLVWGGSSASVDLKRARQFVAEVRPPTTAQLQVLPGGRHLTTDFARMMPESFAFLSRTLDGAPRAH